MKRVDVMAVWNAKVFVESLPGRQKFRLVAEVSLAEHPGFVTRRFVTSAMADSSGFSPFVSAASKTGKLEPPVMSMRLGWLPVINAARDGVHSGAAT